MDSFFAMGGYGGFVWPAYGLAAIVMAAVLVASIRAVRSSERELDSIQRLRPARAKRREKMSAVPAAAEGPES